MSAFLEAFAAHVRERGYNVFSAAEIIGGAEESVRFVQTNRCQNSYSVSKAFVVTAVGLLVNEGRLDPEEKIAPIFPEYAPADGRWQDLSVDMALRHRVGLPAGFLDIDCLDRRAFGTDFLQYLFAQKLECAPGEKRVYTDAAYYLLGRVAERRAGQRLQDFFWERIFGPLEFTEAAWSSCPQGHAMGATGLYITTRDMARLGEVYRCGGEWRGRRILSEQWVQTVRTRGYELRPVGIGGAYGKGGMYGQMLLIVPETGRVVAWHGYEEEKPEMGADLTQFCAQYR